MLLRLVRGVTDHFPIRVTEWVMLWPAVGLWAGLRQSPDMFQTSPSFAYLAHWGDEQTWALVVAACGICRLFALGINGTYKSFRLSPHIRATASIVGVAIWTQVALGFFMAWLNAGGAPSGFIAWSTMAILEIVNTYRSWSDVGKNAAERR